MEYEIEHNYYYPYSLNCIDGRFVIGHAALRDENYGVYMQSFDMDGQLEWPQEDVTITEGVSFNTSDPSIALSGRNVWTCWVDRRYMEWGDLPYCQMLDYESGETQFADLGIPLVNGIPHGEENSIQYNMDYFDFTGDGQGGALAVWDYISDEEMYLQNVRAQRIDENGVLLWGDEGILLEPSDAPQFSEFFRPKLVVLENSTVVYACQTFDENWWLGIWRLQALDMDGNFAWAKLFGRVYYQPGRFRF